MKTTIYIDKSLTPRYSEKGWPIPPGRYWAYYIVSGEIAETGQRAWDIYRDALKKAKSDSIEFENHVIFYPTLNACTAPDSLIEVEIGEVEIVSICTKGSCAQMDGCYADGMAGEFCAARKVARVKPEAKDVPDSELPDANDKNVASIDNALHGYTEGAIGQANYGSSDVPHPEDYCQRCGARNTVWFAHNDLWNKVMGGDGGILCPECFRKACGEIGDKIIFEAKRVNTDDEKDKRIKELEDALADMVTAPVPKMKDWILYAFEKKTESIGHALFALKEVLDELGIK